MRLETCRKHVFSHIRHRGGLLVSLSCLVHMWLKWLLVDFTTLEPHMLLKTSSRIVKRSAIIYIWGSTIANPTCDHLLKSHKNHLKNRYYVFIYIQIKSSFLFEVIVRKNAMNARKLNTYFSINVAFRI